LQQGSLKRLALGASFFYRQGLCFSIFAVDDSCTQQSRFLALTCHYHYHLLGHEFREYEGALESWLFGGADFLVAFCDYLLDPFGGKPQAIPQPELEA
jgi:hypothetical protein